MIEIGKHNTLIINRKSDYGLFLKDDEQGVEVLLPNRYVPERFEIGDNIDVFIYRDSEDRLVAVTDQPLAMRDQFAFLEVKQVNEVGAFLDWGLEKDLYIPFSHQTIIMSEGESHLVFLAYDAFTDRLFASARIKKFLSKETESLIPNEEVDIIVWRETSLGYVVIINHQFEGLVYKNEIFQRLHVGKSYKAYIKQVREEDGKVDLSMQKQGYHLEQVDEYAQRVLDLLHDKGGSFHLNDKSAPDEIYLHLQMSKKNFKKTIGHLFKQRVILIEDKGISLV